MKLWLARTLLVGLCAAVAFTGCSDDDDDDGGSNGGITGPPENDLTEFIGAWVIHTSGTVSYIGCDQTCQEQLEPVIATYFDIPAMDSTCVRVDSLHHLVLVEPFRTEGTTTGQAFDTQASIDCEHVAVSGTDTLVTEIEAEVLLAQSTGTLNSFLRVSVHSPGESECGSCEAWVGITGIRRVTGDCGPLP
jgi:hypothetical protein